MKFILIYFLLLLCLHAEDLIEYDYELDPYYSNVSAFFDLDSAHEVSNATNLAETDIYSHLLSKSFSPNIFLVEAALHPMPILGLYFRQNNEDLYLKSQLNDFNIIKAITAGFEEPYSLSFFMGRMMVFNNTKNTHIGANRAYIGYLVTLGDYSIKNNQAHYDKWFNFEFKLKGTRKSEQRDLDWSFRIGSRLHENRNFVNTLFAGARRSSIDYNKSIFSFLYNSAFSSLIAISSETFKVSDAQFSIEKKWPLHWYDKSSIGIEIGYLYTSGEKYRGDLKDEGIDEHQLILHPNIKF